MMILSSCIAYAQTSGRWLKFYEDDSCSISCRSDIQIDRNNNHVVWLQITYVSPEYRLKMTNHVERFVNSPAPAYSELEKLEFDSEFELVRIRFKRYLSKSGEILHEWEGQGKWLDVNKYKAYEALAPKLREQFSRVNEVSKKKSDRVLTETNKQSDIVYEKLFDKIKDKQSNRKEKGDNSAIDKQESPHKLQVSNVEFGAISDSQASKNYGLFNMLDGKPSTAWIVNLNQTGYGNDVMYGPVFTLNCKKITHIIIHNGYAKSIEAYQNNTRALRLIFCNYDYLSDENKQVSYLYEGIIKDTPEKQTLVVNPNNICNNDIKKIQMVFPVDGLRYGTKWKDLCVSEIEFWGY